MTVHNPSPPLPAGALTTLLQSCLHLLLAARWMCNYAVQNETTLNYQSHGPPLPTAPAPALILVQPDCLSHRPLLEALPWGSNGFSVTDELGT